MKDQGRELWNIQKEFNDKFFETKGGWPESDQLVSVSKDFAIHLIKEATEVLDELSFKMHRKKRDEADRMNVLEEMVDIQKFLWGWAQVWGFTWDDFAEEFRRKSAVVEQRFAQERSLPELESHPCVLVDIDGVLADWQEGFINWLGCSEDLDVPYFETRHALRLWYENEAGVKRQEEIKRLFRQSGAKRNLAVLPGARELLNLIRHESLLKIILLTNRPYDEHFRIYGDTLEWIEKNSLPYDAIIWAKDKGFEAVKTFKNVAWAIDDKAKNVTRLREAGITTVHVNPEDPDRCTKAFYDFALKVTEYGNGMTGSTMENLAFNWNLKQNVLPQKVRA